MRLDTVRIALLLWIAVVIASGVILAGHMRGPLPLDTNLLSLLPAAEQDAVVAQASRQYTETLSRQHLLLVSAATLTEAEAAASALAKPLQASGQFADIRLRINANEAGQLGRFYAPYRFGLLASGDRAHLQQGEAQAITTTALHALYSPASPINAQMLGHDPLLLYYDFLTGLADPASTVHLDDGYLVTEHEGHHWLLVVLTLPESPFALAAQERLLPLLDHSISAAKTQFPSAEILDTGVLRYAAAGVESARHEISTIGTVSMIAVILMLWGVFRSPMPLLVNQLPMLVGLAAALAACLLVFQRVHLMTLVFGSTLIGLSVDYSLHFFADRLTAGPHWRGEHTIERIFSGTMLGLLTSVIGFAPLCLTPFPGMQQIALFCSVGLSVSFLTVIGVLPVIVRRPDRSQGRFWLVLAQDTLLLWQRHPRLLRVLWVVGALFTVGGLWQLHADDDIRQLQGKPPHLLQEENRIRTIIGSQYGGAFLLVEGKTEQALLERSEALDSRLQQSVGRGVLDGFESLSRWLPSIARQQENRRLVTQALLAAPAVHDYEEQLGLDPAVLGDYRTQAMAAGQRWLTPTAWLQHPVSLPWRKLWLGQTGRGYATVVPLHGIHDAAALTALAASTPGVTLVDSVSDISRLLKAYRERASLMVVIAYALIAALLLHRYGWWLMVKAMLPAVLAAAVSLAGVGWLGESLNLFHLLALLLVLGFGVDYTLFLIEGESHAKSTMLAVLLSTCTTLLSFGLLALSSTPAIHTFGITALIGIAVAFILSPTVSSQPEAKHT